MLLLHTAVISVTTVYHVRAFGKEGHDAVGATSMSYLDSSSSSKLKAILGGEDAADVAGWAHNIEESVGWTKDVHFIPQVTDWECKAPEVNVAGVCKIGRCLETGIRHFYRQLTRGKEVPGVNVLQTDTDFTDADALRFLINLVGDISQPLHVGFKSTNFGKDIYVEIPQGFQNRRESQVVSLYDLWDSVLIDTLINNPYNPNFWWSGWTHVRNMHPVTLENEKKRWAEKGIDSVKDWIQDNAEFVCNSVYSDPASKERISYSTDKTNPTKLSSQILLHWQQLIKDRILMSGGRLGIMLLGILSAEDGPSVAKLRRGSAVEVEKPESAANLVHVFDDLDDSHGELGLNRSRDMHLMGYGAGMRNVGVLLGIAFIGVLVYLLFAYRTSPSMHAAKSQIIEMTGAHSKNVINNHKD